MNKKNKRKRCQFREIKPTKIKNKNQIMKRNKKDKKKD